MDCINLLTILADNQIEYISKHGFAPGGVNGPYRNADTPVRNSAHWIITYSFLYAETQKLKYFNTAKTLADFLLSTDNYEKNNSICCRTDARFDHTNGLIGQAWVIEGLIEAARLFRKDKYYQTAMRIFRQQHFNESNSLWEVTDCDGSKGFDLTFNHQLWFAASGAMLLRYEKDTGKQQSEVIANEIQKFLSAAQEKYFNVYEDGLIVHRVNYELSEEEKLYSGQLSKEKKKKSLLKHPLRTVKKKVTDKLSRFSFTEGLEKGYHIFDLYGFALLKEEYGEHPIFHSHKLLRALEYALDSDKLLELRNSCGGEKFNKFSFGYNSPAFEYPYVATIFRDKINYDLATELLYFQMEAVFDGSSFSKNCYDAKTLDARVYELVRYLRKSEVNTFTKKDKTSVCFLTNDMGEIGGRQKVNAQICNMMAECDDLDISVLLTSPYRKALNPWYPLHSNVRLIWDGRFNRGKKDIPYKAFRFINKKICSAKSVHYLSSIYFPRKEMRDYNCFFAENPFDVIIGVGTRPSAVLTYLKNSSKKIGWMHCTYETYFKSPGAFQWHQERLYHSRLGKLDDLIVLTEQDVNTYEQILMQPKPKILTVYNPLTLKPESSHSNNGTNLIFVGRLSYNVKGLDYLIDVLKRIKEVFPAFRIIIVGDGPDREHFEQEIFKFDLQDNVLMAGQTTDVMQYYQKAAIELLTSRQEGFGLVVTEAMTCGIPVVSFATEGPSEIITNGFDGFLVEKYNVDAFAEKVILLLRDNELRNTMGKHAMERSEDFSCENILKQWRKLIVSDSVRKEE